VCRASGGVCDPAESCDGVSNTCPADAKSTAVPRLGRRLRRGDSCDGVNNNCPADCQEHGGVPRLGRRLRRGR
jgi:hypothetical protein